MPPPSKVGVAPADAVAVSVEGFGAVDGEPVQKYTLSCSDLEVDVISYGAIISSVRVKTPIATEDVVLGFDTAQEYRENPGPYFGAVIGRVGNRIAKGRFSLDGKTYTLATNNGPNNLHGGDKGFDKMIWEGTVVGSDSVRFNHYSPDGAEGFPGSVDASVTYTLCPCASKGSVLQITYSAAVSQATPLNLTNHSYFNLDGHASGDVLDHTLSLRCPFYTPVDEELIPTGEIASVKDTAYDFITSAKKIGKDNASVPNGYDTNFVLDQADKDDQGLSTAAIVVGPKSGRKLIVRTTEPGVQLYVGGFLEKMDGKNDAVYGQFGGFCLETQHFPDAVNQPHFPSTIVSPEKPYTSTTTFRFVPFSGKRRESSTITTKAATTIN